MFLFSQLAHRNHKSELKINPNLSQKNQTKLDIKFSQNKMNITVFCVLVFALLSTGIHGNEIEDA
jgi:hypothetical protein